MWLNGTHYMFKLDQVSIYALKSFKNQNSNFKIYVLIYLT